MNKLLKKYKKQVVPEMMKKFGYKNIMAVPKIEKIIVNSGFGKKIIGRSGQDRKKIEDHILKELSFITGQMPSLRKAKKSIATFKLRKGMYVGAVATLRGKKMYDFAERLIHLTFPRTRDFRGIDHKFIDKRGNLSLGFKEHTAFSEISAEREKSIFSLEITIVTNSKNKEQGLELLKLIGFPMKTK